MYIYLYSAGHSKYFIFEKKTKKKRKFFFFFFFFILKNKLKKGNAGASIFTLSPFALSNVKTKWYLNETSPGYIPDSGASFYLACELAYLLYLLKILFKKNKKNKKNFFLGKSETKNIRKTSSNKTITKQIDWKAPRKCTETTPKSMMELDTSIQKCSLMHCKMSSNREL